MMTPVGEMIDRGDPDDIASIALACFALVVSRGDDTRWFQNGRASPIDSFPESGFLPEIWIGAAIPSPIQQKLKIWELIVGL